MDDKKARELLIFGGGIITGAILYRTFFKRPDVEMTVAIIKPDAVANGHANAILDEISAVGLEIVRIQEVQFTVDQARFYYIHMLKSPEKAKFHEAAVMAMAAGLSIVLVLRGENVIRRWKSMVGPPKSSIAREKAPTSLRARYGSDEIGKNGVHGSGNKTEVAEDLMFLHHEFTNFKDLVNTKL